MILIICLDEIQGRTLLLVALVKARHRTACQARRNILDDPNFQISYPC